MHMERREVIDTAEMDETEIEKTAKDGFIPVPENLKRDASKFLNGRKRAIMSRHDKSKLNEWATKMRAEKRRKKKKAANKQKKRL